VIDEVLPPRGVFTMQQCDCGATPKASGATLQNLAASLVATPVRGVQLTRTLPSERRTAHSAVATAGFQMF